MDNMNYTNFEKRIARIWKNELNEYVISTMQVDL
jgi:hypothetical protein